MLWLISSCTPTPEPIEYGSDMCDFCKMSIVDAQHGAELVSSKGKVFKFDAIECLIGYSKEKKDTQFAFELVNDYSTPKELIEAKQSTFLISENLSSPMGANLTAFGDKKNAEEMLSAKGGKLFSWSELNDHFNKQK
jgi:copper chaperone NosL